MRRSSIITPICFAVYYNHPNALQLLLDHGASVDCMIKDEYGPIHYATTNHTLTNVLNILIDNGANVNLRTKQKRLTPLLIAAYNGNLDGLMSLIDVDADINILDMSGRGVIHYAAWGNRINIINHFIAMDNDGTHINFFLPDSNGTTPYMMSTNHEVRNTLLQCSPFRRPSA